MTDKCVLLIIGAGRSGTSAMSRVLSLCGCSLPDSVLGATSINQKGMWEPVDVWKLNSEFMLRHGTLYSDPSMRFHDSLIESNERELYIERVRLFLSRLNQEKISVVKHPDISELIGFWMEAADREGVLVKFIIPIRHPQEAISSIAALRIKDGVAVSAELASAFWLKRNLLAERDTRASPRIFIDYSSFLANWRLQIERVSHALDISLVPTTSEIDDFLTRKLYHQRGPGYVVETFGAPWLTRVYKVLAAAANDEQVDVDAMDEIYHAYRASERTFRVAHSNFRALFDAIDPNTFGENIDHVPVLRSGMDF